MTLRESPLGSSPRFAQDYTVRASYYRIHSSGTGFIAGVSLIASFIAFACFGGCTDRGEGLLGTGPDDRVDRGGGPDTISVAASSDTYFERTVDEGRFLLAGELTSAGPNGETFNAVTFIKFGALPAAGEEISEAHLVLYVADSGPTYSLRISRLRESAPSEVPFWPGPPHTGTIVDTSGVSAVKDTVASDENLYFIKVEIPPSWISAWISDPSSNYGLRISGGPLDVSQSGRVERRFWAGGQVAGSTSLGPRLETLKAGATEPQRWSSTEDYFIFNPSISSPVGNPPPDENRDLLLGGVFGYRILMRFDFADTNLVAERDSLPEAASINRALLKLRVDRSRPQLNEGIFGSVGSAVVDSWSEDSINVNVGLNPAQTQGVEIDAEDESDNEVVFDVTALVELFAESNLFEVAVVRSGAFSFGDKVVIHSSEALDPADRPSLTIIFTTPPGGRYSD